MQVALDPYEIAMKVDGILTSRVFAWEERAEASCRLMRERIREYVGR